jgi:4'-phosphopantetheinyl transferase EntD
MVTVVKIMAENGSSSQQSKSVVVGRQAARLPRAAAEQFLQTRQRRSIVRLGRGSSSSGLWPAQVLGEQQHNDGGKLLELPLHMDIWGGGGGGG